MLSSICVFSVFVWTGENDLKRLRVDANFFENEEKKILVWSGPLFWNTNMAAVTSHENAAVGFSQLADKPGSIESKRQRLNVK